MKLITFDRTKNINYFGECKLQFNGIEKCLNIKMLDKNPEETMKATFNRIFICKNNFLCCMNQSNCEYALILVFSNKEKCEHIFNAILKSKVRFFYFFKYFMEDFSLVKISNFILMKKNYSKITFFFPLIKAVKNGANGFQDLKTIVLDFVNSLENDEKICYFDTFVELLLSSELKDNIDDEKYVEKSIHFPSASEKISSKPLECDTPKRSLNKNISYQECEENDDCQRKKRKISVSIKLSPNNLTNSHFDLIEPTPKNSPENVDFDIVEYLHDGKFDKKLLVFTSNERKQCYEFTFFKTTINYYRCIKCFVQEKIFKINAIFHNDGSLTFDFNTGKHFCEPTEYLPENYQSLIFKPSNFNLVQRSFKGKKRPLLIIFDSNDKNMCYRFGFESRHNFFFCYECKKQGRFFTARFIQYQGKTAIEFNRFEHICKPQKYIP